MLIDVNTLVKKPNEHKDKIVVLKFSYVILQ